MLDTTLTGRIRKPVVTDVPEMKRLIDAGVTQGALLPRTTAEIFEHIRDFHIYVDENGVGGCCALHIDMADLAEVRSLVVRPDLQGRGIGQQLIAACLAEAEQLNITRVYALTRAEAFFLRLGFGVIDKHDLPNKVFRDCVRCPLFPDCDEIAVMRVLKNTTLGNTGSIFE